MSMPWWLRPKGGLPQSPGAYLGLGFFMFIFKRSPPAPILKQPLVFRGPTALGETCPIYKKNVMFR